MDSEWAEDLDREGAVQEEPCQACNIKPDPYPPAQSSETCNSRTSNIDVLSDIANTITYNDRCCSLGINSGPPQDDSGHHLMSC